MTTGGPAMPTIRFHCADGSVRSAEGRIGTNLMEVARQNRIPGIIGDCGGHVSCGTCVIDVAPEWMDKVPPMRADERELLELLGHDPAESRLSCQIRLRDTLDGLVVMVGEI